jgi:iron complex outermembrane recepter protein
MRKRARKTIIVIAASMLAMSTSALAQRTDDNAVTESEDAFGKSVGDERIGIYSPFQVRGFSPVDAGNVRIEGLYFDQQSNPTSRLTGSSTVRVGISAQGYPFPAPTGIADYELRRPGAKPLLSLGAQYGPWDGKLAEFDAQLPIDGDKLGLAGGAGIYRESNPFHGRPETYSFALLGRYAPRAGIEVIPFWSHIRYRDDESQPIIFTNGAFLPPKIRRDIFLGQKWADFGGNLYNYGVVAKVDPFGLDAQLGVFRSVNEQLESHFDLLFDTDRTGRVGNRVVIRGGGDRFASTSGEFRLSKSIKDGPRGHKFILALRGREQRRRFGGENAVSLGVSQIGVQDFRPEPAETSIGPKTRDSISQKTFGIGYQGIWPGVGEISLGAQKTDYRKETTDPDPNVVFPVTRAKPWLISANAAAYLADWIALYGGYTRGLEESPVAPSEAVNRNEAPPAIRTEQKEAGVRLKLSKKVTAVVGYFDVEKPYFNLDAASRFRQLGAVRNRGVEFSLAGEVAPGLVVVAGNVYLDAEVSGEEVDRGLIGDRPIGTFRRHTIISMDYKVPWVEPLSLTASFEGTSARTANAANTLLIPTRAVVGLGARYRFKIGDAPALLRFNVGNVTNTFGYAVGGSGFLIPNGNRRFSLALSADL